MSTRTKSLAPIVAVALLLLVGSQACAVVGFRFQRYLAAASGLFGPPEAAVATASGLWALQAHGYDDYNLCRYDIKTGELLQSRVIGYPGDNARMRADLDGRLYIAGAGWVYRCAADGSSLPALDVPDDPVGMEFVGGKMHILSYGHGEQSYVVSHIPGSSTVSAPQPIDWANGMTSDGAGHLYTLSFDHIRQWDAAWNIVGEWDTFGAPQVLAADKWGTITCIGYDINPLIAYSSTGVSLARYGGDTLYGVPDAVVCQDGCLYIVDERGRRVQRWRPDVVPTCDRPTSTPNGSVATNVTLHADVSGISDADDDPVTCEWEWRIVHPDGSSATVAAADLPPAASAKGDLCVPRVRPYDGTDYGRWQIGEAVRILDSPPTLPAQPTISPLPASPANDLRASAGAGSSDLDGDALVYQYRWWRDAGSGFALTSHTTQTLPRTEVEVGQSWRVQIRARAGGLNSDWVSSADVKIDRSNRPPTVPTVIVTPRRPLTDNNLTATASGSTDADGDTLTYEYSWARYDEGGWTEDVYGGAVLARANTTKGQQFKVRARAKDDHGDCDLTSAWSPYSAAVTIDDAPPTAPAAVTIAPAAAFTFSTLTASITAGTDADGDVLDTQIEWAVLETRAALTGRSDPVWSDWDNEGPTLPATLTTRGQQWKCRARHDDGTKTGPWRQSAPITIRNSRPTAPTVLTLTPSNPDTTQALAAAAAGGRDADGDALTLVYQWARSTDGGADWDAWFDGTSTLSADLTSKGEVWVFRVCNSDGELRSSWSESLPVTIGDAPLLPPEQITLAPLAARTNDDVTATVSGGADPDADPYTPEVQWQCDGGTWVSFSPANKLPKAQTVKGQVWVARARYAAAGSSTPWIESAPLTILNSAPTAPATVSLSPLSPAGADDLTAGTSGGTDADGDALTTRYKWSVSRDNGATWTTLPEGPANVLSADRTDGGDKWKVAARLSDGSEFSNWRWSTIVTIAGTPLAAPTSVTLSPADPRTAHEITATPEGGGAGGETAVSECEWRHDGEPNPWFSENDLTLSPGQTSKGQVWQARVRYRLGEIITPWTYSGTVEILNTAPTAPTSVVVTPTEPLDADDLTAAASGGSDDDGDSLTPEYQWAISSDGGSTWSDWALHSGTTLAAASTAPNNKIKARARNSDGSEPSAWVESTVVTVGAGNNPPPAPGTVSIDPPMPFPGTQLMAIVVSDADPDGDEITFKYSWQYSSNGGATWNDFGDENTSIVSGPYVQSGQVWHFSARCYDGALYSSWVQSANVTVQAGGPMVGALAAPTGDGLVAISLSLTAGARVQARICNLAGRTVAVLPERDLPRGLSALVWNGRSTAGTRAPSGYYLVRVSARSSKGEQAQALAPVQLRR